MFEGIMGLEWINGFQLLEAWRQYGSPVEWALKCRILPEEDGIPVGTATDWFIRVSSSYPAGYIEFFPAQEGGIDSTFPHQLFNHTSKGRFPWRTGKICLDTPVQIIGRQASDTEPIGESDRLRWHATRAVEWVRSMWNGELLVHGAPFELPHVPSCGLEKIVFNEDAHTYVDWQKTSVTYGQVLALNLRTRKTVLGVEAFHQDKGGVVVRYDWGQFINAHREESQTGAWIRLASVPIFQDWQLPLTWGELRQVLSRQVKDADFLLQQVLSDFRDAEKHFLLLGFPIPNAVGDVESLMHWLAIRLPILAYQEKVQDGFRCNDLGYYMHDKIHALNTNQKIIYIDSENWNSAQTKTRGSFPMVICDSRVAVIGAGAIGSCVSEMLVRGGCSRITIIDSDTVEIGNLARHTLSMVDVANSKATCLCERLNSLSPDAQTIKYDSKISRDDDGWIDALEKCDVIVDCTGDDNALRTLANHEFIGPKFFTSISVGYEAKRLFVFASLGKRFQEADFRTKINPWLQKERREMEGVELPWQGIGCYHPVFPARSDDIWLWSAIAIKLLEKIIDAETQVQKLWVYELDRDSLCIREVSSNELTPEELEVDVT